MNNLPILKDDFVALPYSYPSYVQPYSAEAVLAAKRQDLAFELLNARDRDSFAIRRYEAKYSAISNIAQASAIALVRAIETRGDNTGIEIEGAEYEPGFLGFGRRANVSFKWTVEFRK